MSKAEMLLSVARGEPVIRRVESRIRLLAQPNLRAWVRRAKSRLVSGGAIGLLALAAPAAWSQQKAFTPSDPPNSPFGVGRGLFQGRVVWIRDTNAVPWEGEEGNWFEEASGVNQVAVDRMLSLSLQALAGATNDPAAWDKIFRFHNQVHGRGDVGYTTNESIALKINCNNSYEGYSDSDNEINATPQSVLAMLRQLVNQAGVPEDRIVVYEAVRVVPDCVYNPCHAEFPEVMWMDSQGDGTNGRQPVIWQTNAFNYSADSYLSNSIPDAVYQAAYLINMALLKGHWHAGVSLTAKNHLGTISGAPHNHTLIQSYLLPSSSYHPLVDLIGAQQLGGKTLLFMIDGLYGVPEVTDLVSPATAAWSNLFNGQWSASYFLSLDPVAIDSVGLDFLTFEFADNLAHGHTENCDNFLHEAAQANDPPSGVPYQPDGTRLPSLGVHEHWNNPTDKQYSRNLGTTNGIELVSLEISPGPAVAIIQPPGGAVLPFGTNIFLQALAAEGPDPTLRVDFYCSGELISTATNSPYTTAWTNATPGNWALTAVITDTNNLSATSAVVHLTIEQEILPVDPPGVLSAQVASNILTLSFGTVSGHTYRVDFTDGLLPASWNPLCSNLSAIDSSITVTDSVSGRLQTYYRAVLIR